jgi:DNA-binding NtrC family response regulator
MRETTEVKEREDGLRKAVQRSAESLQEKDVAPLNNLTGSQSQVGGQQSDVEAGNGSLDQILTTIEKREILGALRRANGQRTLAARLLGISRSRLYRRMEALGIDPRAAGSGDVR